MSQALNNCVNCLPGLRDMDQAIKNINTMSARLASDNIPRGSDRSFQEIQIELSNRAGNLNQAASDVVTASHSSPQQVAGASNRFSKAYEDFVDTGMDMAAVTTETETKTEIVTGLRSVTLVSNKLLLSSKSLLADPNAPNAKNNLSQAARYEPLVW